MPEPPTSRAPDEYERTYMDADRAVFIAWVRQHPRLRLVLTALFVGVAVFTAQQVFVFAPWLWGLRDRVPLLVAMIFGVYAVCALLVMSLPVLALIGAVTRVVLTPTHLRVHRGLATTDVPLASVDRVATEHTARWFPELPAFGGVSRRNVVYQSFRTKRSLRVEWRDERGRARRLWVYLDEAEALRERIEAQRGGATGVRVALDAAEDVDEAEALAVETAAQRAKADRST
jgi:hypothetical protein